MELSFFLAKLIGLVLVLVAASLLLNRKNVDLLFDLYSHSAAVYVTGVLETLIGIVFVLTHNVWTADFRVIITIVGWVLLVRGVARIFLPSRAAGLLERFRKAQSIIVPLLVFILLVGAYLAYEGFAG